MRKNGQQKNLEMSMDNQNIKEAIDLYLETTEDEMVFYNSQLYDEVLV